MKSVLCLILLVHISSILINPGVGDSWRSEEPFKVVWNSPTKACESKFGIIIDVSKYGIKENPDDEWRGPEIALFYEGTLGLYPKYSTETGEAINGGLPQLGNLTKHLEKAHADVEQSIPDKDFPGLGVVDWESWRPLWDRDFDSKAVYRQMSIAKVKAKHPDWPDDKVKATAKREFEKAARAYMEETLRVVERVRPNGHWGFYGFPRCDNRDGKSTCSTKDMDENDLLMWLFNASSAVYPAAYLSASTVDDFAFVHGQVLEAFRVRTQLKAPNKPVYMYGTYRLTDSETFYSESALNASLRQPADMGAAGVVLWGASKESDTYATCLALKGYLDSTLGPFVAHLLNTTSSCSRRLCSSNGRCVMRRTQDDVTNIIQRRRGWLWSYLMEIWEPIRSWLQHGKNPTLWESLKSWYDGPMGEEEYVCHCYEGAKGERCGIVG